MYTRRNIQWSIILQFSWRIILFFAVWSACITLFHVLLKPYQIGIAIPFLPLSTIGIAVAIYLAFKNGQSYERL